MTSYFAIIAVTILACLAFVGNILISIVGLKLPAHPKNVTQIFLISLAIADILLSIQVPFYILGLMEKITYFYPKGSTAVVLLCSISGYMLWMSIKANVLMVMVMGIDRMLATCYASWYLKNVNRKPAIRICVVVWILSILFASFPGLFSLISWSENPYYYDIRFQTCTPIIDHCSTNMSSTSLASIYILLEQVVSLIIPFICIIFCYICICTKIFNLRKIRTISRHFSKRQVFTNSRSREQRAAKLRRRSEKNEDDEVGLKDPPGVREVQITYTKDSDYAHFQLAPKVSLGSSNNCETACCNNNKMSACVPPKTVFTIKVESPQGFRINASPPIAPQEYCLNTAIDDITATSALTDDPLCEDHVTNASKSYSIDPQMVQPKRFKFFVTSGADQNDKFAECVEPDSKTGILASSLNKIEKHYTVIESAREELSKKMRVYKYQIRVARTAIVICTLFILCYIPYIVAVIQVITSPRTDQECLSKVTINTLLQKWAHMFLFLNSAFNVIIYGMMHRTVRAQLSKILLFCTEKPKLSNI